MRAEGRDAREADRPQRRRLRHQGESQVLKFDGGINPAKGCFEKLETKSPNDCLSFDDTAAAEELVDSCVWAFVAAIDPPPPSQTQWGAGKNKCVAKKLKSILKCYQTAQTPGKPADPNAADCVTRAKAKFDGGADPAKGCFVKLEAKAGNDCQVPTGNQAALEALVDSCAGAFVALIERPPATTTTTMPGCTPAGCIGNPDGRACVDGHCGCASPGDCPAAAGESPGRACLLAGSFICVPECNGPNVTACNGGCCSAAINGTCQAGTADTACGIAGNTCVDCQGAACVQGTCMP